MSDDRQDPVTLEQLLRLKRAERPSPESWAQFERELRAKQLAAIVEPQPWWLGLARVGREIRRHQLSLGAAAALAAAGFGLHDYAVRRAVAPGDTNAAGPRIAAAPAAVKGAVATARASLAAPTARLVALHRAAAEPAPTSAVPSAAEPAALAIDDISPGESLPERRSAPPSTRFAEAGLAAFPLALAVDEGRDLSSFARNDDSRLLPMRARVTDPLAQMSSPSEELRSRLVADAQPAAAVEATPLVPDRLVGDFAADRFPENEDHSAEAARRYAVGVEQQAVEVSFKF